MTNETILVVDDDPLFLQMIELYLGRQGYRVITARDGEDGLEVARAEQPNVVVLDVMMPGLSGFEVCRLMREDPATAEIPVLMLTAKTRLADKIEGFRAGTDDYLTKPVELAELLARVRALIARSTRTPAPAGELVIFWGAKGGIGVSTLAASVAVSIVQQNHPAILLDMHPGFGHADLQFGIGSATSLASLLSEQKPVFSRPDVENALVKHRSGLRILVGGDSAAASGRLTPDLASALLEILRHSGDPVIVDLPAGMHAFTQTTLLAASQIVFVVEGRPLALRCAERRIRWLLDRGFSPGEINAVMVNRQTAAIMPTPQEIGDRLGVPLRAVTPPVSDDVYAAEQAGYPVILHPGAVDISHSVQRIAAFLVGSVESIGRVDHPPLSEVPAPSLPRRRRPL